jgi:uncharacterized protein YdeI (YjbR/CyaY-like superfamily)
MPKGPVFFNSPEALRRWFARNAAAEAELIVGYMKRGTGVASITWPESVDEALCVGWIDGIRKRLDDTRSAQRFTPRRKGSNWSAINVDKVATLTAQGRMRPAGLRAFAGRTEAKTGVYSYEQAETHFSDDELERFRAVPAAWADWERRAPSYRKAVTFWVTSAKGADTRARRFEALIADSTDGVPVRPMRWNREKA